MLGERSRKSDINSDTPHYGVFYPTNLGNQCDRSPIRVRLDLNGRGGPRPLPELNAGGALYVDAGSYTEDALKQTQPDGSFRFMTVNPNYLKQYPVKDEHGQPIAVAQRTPDWIIVAPATLKNSNPHFSRSSKSSTAVRSRRHITASATTHLRPPTCT